jgi:hypothetical protein
VLSHFAEAKEYKYASCFTWYFKAVPNFPAVTDFERKIKATTEQLQCLVVGNPVLPVAPFSVQQLNINPEI